MPQLLIIFDLDGTLVDSETLCNQAFLDLLPSLKDSVEELVNRYRGQKLSEILRDIEHRIAAQLPQDFELRYRKRVADLFTTDLKPTTGVPEMLAAIEHAFCIASSGPPEKIRHALSVTGLDSYFEDRYFSSYLIKSWKPDPGLFIHAATSMGFSPDKCIVIEDSPVGLEAASSAGMRALLYSPNYDGQDTNTFSSMSALPLLINQLAMEC